MNERQQRELQRGLRALADSTRNMNANASMEAAVLAQIGTRAEVRDISIEEPDIEDVVRRIYLSRRP